MVFQLKKYCVLNNIFFSFHHVFVDSISNFHEASLDDNAKHPNILLNI